MNKVQDYIISNFLYGEAGKLAWDTSFLKSSIIDSTGVLELVSFLEETYRITVADDEMIPENLDSLAQIDAYLKKKLNGSYEGRSGDAGA